MSDVKPIQKNDNNKIEINQIKRGKAKQIELDLNAKELQDVYSAIRNIIYQLIKTKGSWEGAVQKYTMLLVKEIIEFAEGFKHIAGKDKKELVLLVLNEIFEKELNETEMNNEVKNFIKCGISTVLEPSLEMALYAAKGNIKIRKHIRKWKWICILCKHFK